MEMEMVRERIGWMDGWIGGGEARASQQTEYSKIMMRAGGCSVWYLMLYYACMGGCVMRCLSLNQAWGSKSHRTSRSSTTPPTGIHTRPHPLLTIMSCYMDLLNSIKLEPPASATLHNFIELVGRPQVSLIESECRQRGRFTHMLYCGWVGGLLLGVGCSQPQHHTTGKEDYPFLFSSCHSLSLMSIISF